VANRGEGGEPLRCVSEAAHGIGDPAAACLHLRENGAERRVGGWVGGRK
jgi:hypothetical protein